MQKYILKVSKIASGCLKKLDNDKGRGSLLWVFKDGKEQDMFMCRGSLTVYVENQGAV